MATVTLKSGLNEANIKLTPIAPAPLPAHLAGTVKDAKTGALLAGAKVLLDSEVQFTDVNGVFNFLDLAPGTYNFTVEKEGYVTYE